MSGDCSRVKPGDRRCEDKNAVVRLLVSWLQIKLTPEPHWEYWRRAFQTMGPSENVSCARCSLTARRVRAASRVRVNPRVTSRVNRVNLAQARAQVCP